MGTAIPKPSWQKDPDCSSRTDADISSEAGVSPGVAEYSDLYGGWFGVCGTSVASPFTAGVIGLAGNATKLNAGEGFWKLKKKELKKDLHDIYVGLATDPAAANISARPEPKSSRPTLARAAGAAQRH